VLKIINFLYLTLFLKFEIMDTYNEKAQCVYDFLATLSKETPEVGRGFLALHDAAGKDKALSSRTKELIALGIAITIRCEGCIACHVKAAMSLGATREEIFETIGVALVMGGGPSVVYSEKAYKAMEEFDEA
jgi:AhpD family alkylhydroperoxidase